MSAASFACRDGQIVGAISPGPDELRAIKDDRRWFLTRRGRTLRLRKPAPGEIRGLGCVDAEAGGYPAMVLVRKVRRGDWARIREGTPMNLAKLADLARETLDAASAPPALSITCTPPATLAEIREHYSNATIEPEAGELHPQDAAIIGAWLDHVGETCPQVRGEILDRATREPDTLDAYRRAAVAAGVATPEAPKAAPAPGPRHLRHLPALPKQPEHPRGRFRPLHHCGPREPAKPGPMAQG